MTKRAGRAAVSLGKSKAYKYVYKYRTDTMNITWLGNYGKKMKFFKTEREAAIFVDKALIEAYKEPLNVLIRK